MPAAVGAGPRPRKLRRGAPLTRVNAPSTMPFEDAMPLLSRRPLITLTLAAALALSAAALVAQSRAATPQTPAVARVPEPKDVFGFAPGDDYKLASHEQTPRLLRASSTPSSDRISRRATSARAPRAATMIVADHLERSQPQEPRAVSGDRAPACRSRAASSEPRGARAVEGGQGHRLDRRRPARHRSGGRAAHAGARPGGWCRPSRTKRSASATTRSSC